MTNIEWQGSHLTLDQFRTATAHLPGATHVVIATDRMAQELDGWYVNINLMYVPDGTEDSEWAAVTMYIGDSFDSRQL